MPLFFGAAHYGPMMLFVFPSRVLSPSPEHCKQYRIPESFLFDGTICVAVSPDNNFSRGRVTGGPYAYNGKKYYSVFWVDYGGSDHVPDYAIHFVKKPFFHLPMQAIPATLALGQYLPGKGRGDVFADMYPLRHDEILISLIYVLISLF